MSAAPMGEMKKGEACGSALWCCVLIRYFYCFKLDGVIWQVSARWGNESTVAQCSFLPLEPNSTDEFEPWVPFLRHNQ
jgi:hypothetical protein